MKTMRIVLIAMFAMAGFSCSTQIIDDAELAVRIKTKLAADAETTAIKIGVDVVNGAVTLSGVVPTEREKSKAELLARNTEGVKQVTNNITIDPNTVGVTNVNEKAQEAANDAAILAKIKGKLLVEGITGTDVDVVKGVVTIKGQLENEKRVAQAVEIARSTTGVTSVNNQLTVKK